MGLNVRTSSSAGGDRTSSGAPTSASGEQVSNPGPDYRTSFADSASSYSKRGLKVDCGDGVSPSLSSKASTPVNMLNVSDFACGSPGSASKKVKGGLLHVSYVAAPNILGRFA